MSYVRVDSSVPRNRKFLKAGPAASWLWLCGLTYCQEGLTDGFIPFEALQTLGVLKDTTALAAKLVLAGLWHVEHEPRGWRVHDYLEHNKPAAEVNRIKNERRLGGNLGGRPKVNLEGKPSSETLPETFPVDVDASASEVVAGSKEGGPGETKLDVAFESFKAAYPAERRYFGRIVNDLFISAIESGKTTAARMLAALENHKSSAQWQDPSKIPNPEKWLEQERWNATMPAPKAVGTTEKTAGNADALRRFVERHETH